ncbi:MAG: hypothetical protein B7W97_00105 [Mycobacterium sp. 20-66-4]|nr:MAG: hypothetical protein B7W97_00105 [Mycobacterium sp. 20-66-4]
MVAWPPSSRRAVTTFPTRARTAANAGSGRPRYTAHLARQWAAAGARIVGGCCRVRPADIAEVATVLR